jgi:hypothetical protein
MLTKAAADHSLILVWNDVTDLWLIFFDQNFAAANEDNYHNYEPARTKFVVSVDGKVIANFISIREVKTLPSVGHVAVEMPHFIAWDKNNHGHDTGLETGQIFDAMRHGKLLTIETDGATYTEELRGVGSALDHFQDCFML